MLRVALTGGIATGKSTVSKNTISKHTQSITELDAAVTEAWTLQGGGDWRPLRKCTPASQAPKQTPVLQQETPAAHPPLQ